LFRFARDTETEHSWLTLPSPPLPPPDLAALEDAPQSLPLSPAMAHIIDTAAELAKALDVPTKALAALITAALVLYLEEARAQGHGLNSPPVHAAVTSVRRHIRTHLARSLSLRDLAGAANVTPTYLVQLFRRELGTTPIRYLWSQRTQHGIYLLQHTGLSIAEIAERAGFQSPHHFARLVRASTGLPPTAVRSTSWQTGGSRS